MKDWKDHIWFGRYIWKQEENYSNLLFAKRPSPKIGGVCLGNAECVSLELSTWKDGFDLGQHVTEDQRELGKVSSARERDKQSILNTGNLAVKQCKCTHTHTKRKVNSQHSLLSQFLVLELVWKLMCRTRLPSNSTRIQCNLMHTVWRACRGQTKKQTLTGLRPTEQRRSAPVAADHCKMRMTDCLQWCIVTKQISEILHLVLGHH